jgi:hypothetical protein
MNTEIGRSYALSVSYKSQLVASMTLIFHCVLNDVIGKFSSIIYGQICNRTK